MAIRQWEPEFKASKATCSSIAVWIRLPELPIEYYDPIVLKNVGSTIGPVLRIDSHTFNGARGRFARICVQINIDKPLINSIKIGKMVQSEQYEGIQMLCFVCGCIRHRKDSCPTLVRGPEPTVEKEGNNATDANSKPKEACTTETSQKDGKAGKEEVYGDWMVVKRKTRPPGRGWNTRFGYGSEGAGFKGDGDDKSDSRYPPRNSKTHHKRDVKRKAMEKETLVKKNVELVLAQLNQKNTQNQRGEMAIENSDHVLSQLNQKHTRNHRSKVDIDNSGTRKPNSRKGFTNHGKNHTIGWESRKWPIKATTEGALVKKNSPSCLGGFTFETKAQENEYSNREMGNFSEGLGNTNWRQDNRRDTEGSNRHNGLV